MDTDKLWPAEDVWIGLANYPWNSDHTPVSVRELPPKLLVSTPSL